MNIKRYLRLYAYFLRFSFSKALEFRLDFFFRIFMDIIYYIVNISFFQIVFQHTGSIGGWNLGQTYIFVGTFLVLDAVAMTLFSNNMWWLPILVNKGDLDYYLVRPVSPLFFLGLRDFAVNSSINLVIAVSFLAWAVYNHILTNPGATISLFQILLFIFFLGCGIFLYFCLRVLMLLPVFWIHSARGMDEIFWALNRCIERPDRIFIGVGRIILTTILPFAVMASFPARILLEGPVPSSLLHMGILTVLFACILSFAWKRALAAYSSASS